MSSRDAAFAECFAARADAMRGTAYLLCGDWRRAEDLVQTAFTKLYLARDRLARQDALDACTRQVVVRTFVSETRRGWFRRVTVGDLPVERAAAPVGSPEDRQVLLTALARVPARQRAVLVLRYWEDLSVRETADALGCSEGTVKSQAARGLSALRALVVEQREVAW